MGQFFILAGLKEVEMITLVGYKYEQSAWIHAFFKN